MVRSNISHGSICSTKKPCRKKLDTQVQTLHQAAMALFSSSAKFCAPVWERTNHTHLVDSQLNAAMCIISRTLRPMPTEWLPVLCNIALAHIHRAMQSAALLTKLRETEDLPVHQDVFNPLQIQLGSRHPIWCNPHQNPSQSQTSGNWGG